MITLVLANYDAQLKTALIQNTIKDQKKCFISLSYLQLEEMVNKKSSAKSMVSKKDLHPIFILEQPFFLP